MRRRFMLKDNIYIGNINIVENGAIRLYQNTSPLLSLGNGSYVNLALYAPNHSQ